MGGGETSSTVNLDPRLQGLVDSILDYAPQVMERPFPQYTLPRIAGFTPDQLQGFQMVRDNVGSQQPAMNQAMQTASNFAQKLPVVGMTPLGGRQNPQQPMQTGAQPNMFQQG